MRARGMTIGSTTGYPRAVMAVVARAAAAQGYVPDCVVCAEDTPKGRPGPFPALKALIDMAVSPVEAVVKIGDTVVDVEEGLNGGMWSIGITVTGNEVGLSLEEWQALPEAEQARLRAAAGGQAAARRRPLRRSTPSPTSCRSSTTSTPGSPAARSPEAVPPARRRRPPSEGDVNLGAAPNGLGGAARRRRSPGAARPRRGRLPPPVAVDAVPVGHPPRRGDLDRGRRRPALHGLPRQQRPPPRPRPSAGARGDRGAARRAVLRPAPLHLRAGGRPGRAAAAPGAARPARRQGAVRARRLGGRSRSRSSSPASPPAGSRRCRSGTPSTAPASAPPASAARRCSAAAGIGPLLPGAEHVPPFACFRCPFGFPQPSGRPDVGRCRMACARTHDLHARPRGRLRRGRRRAGAGGALPAAARLLGRRSRAACRRTRHAADLRRDPDRPRQDRAAVRLRARRRQPRTSWSSARPWAAASCRSPRSSPAAGLDVAEELALGHYTHEKNPVLAAAALGHPRRHRGGGAGRARRGPGRARAGAGSARSPGAGRCIGEVRGLGLLDRRRAGRRRRQPRRRSRRERALRGAVARAVLQDDHGQRADPVAAADHRPRRPRPGDRHPRREHRRGVRQADEARAIGAGTPPAAAPQGWTTS